MGHIFEGFLGPICNGFENLNYAVEKDTKKAMKDALHQLGEWTKGEKNRIIHLDITSIMDEEKVACFVSYSLFLFRNISYQGIKSLLIKLHPAFETEITDEDKKNFMILKERGGTWIDYMKIKGVNWGAINKQIVDRTNLYLGQLEEIEERYMSFINNVSQESKEFMFKRKWNFHVRQTDLLGLYKKCFNEVERVFSPEMCCNPNPSFQRSLVWSEEKKRSFIQSILSEIPIGSFYVNCPKKYDPYLSLCEGYGSMLWDGKQRIHALDDFIKGKFAVQIDGEWIKYNDNPSFFNNKFSSCLITEYFSNFDTLKEVVEAYVAINTAQVKHTDEDLESAVAYLKIFN
ncbi:DUF262 domain-containing protein (plasmid) [Paenibacillus thiaminolyticus]|uniref:DUF262 domain-containing protein n=1 Tax=Paenibacillus thiaminolyticus TaxID=49283 RepID=UPI00232B06E6|nr:DUF262 domain-containing protein [Paenibacillus thiaminolyticus]WCF11659.1 DUF262 domain-containing protein [Paenibacillus thiaminolyticus]